MFGTCGKRLHVSLELGVTCFLRRNWLFVLAQQTLEVLINGLSLRFRAISQDFRSLLVYLKYSAHLRHSNRELSLIIVARQQLGNDQSDSDYPSCGSAARCAEGLRPSGQDWFDSFGATPQIPGHSPARLRSYFRKGIAFPHIKRPSRAHRDRRYSTGSGSDRPVVSTSVASLVTTRSLIIHRGYATAHCGKPSARRNDSRCFRDYASARRRSLLIHSEHSREQVCDGRLMSIGNCRKGITSSPREKRP